MIFQIFEVIVHSNSNREGLSPGKLRKAFAVRTGMCSGTEHVFSTGFWWISVHLDDSAFHSMG